MTPDDREVEQCLEGDRLYGDDFSPEQVQAWFENQREAYASLGAGDREHYRYAYHALDQLNGFAHLPQRRFERALGIGSAYGDELIPIAPQLGHIDIVDPSSAFVQTEIAGVPATYHVPRVDGHLEFADGTFDLITCFAVLQHIPNVSAVLREMRRCLAPGGYALIRDSIMSLGDWRKPRPGVTREQRGIPLALFRRMLRDAGFHVVRETKCMFSLTSQLVRRAGISAYNSPALVRIDRAVSRLFGWNTKYHRVTLREKLAPWSVYYVLTA